jgi:hypothetical protein
LASAFSSHVISGKGLTAFAVIAAVHGSTRGVRPTLHALARPLCRYESIILLADDASLLTELSNVVAYPCRPSRTEDRRHGPHPGLLWIPPAGDQCFGHQDFPGKAAPSAMAKR